MAALVLNDATTGVHVHQEVMIVSKETFHGRRERVRKVSRERRSGQAIVEAALVVPVLLAILIGIVEFGWLVKNNHTVANATREGARYAALGKKTADVQDRVRFASAPLTVANSAIILQYYNTSSSTWVSWPADSATGNSVPVDAQIKVLVRVPHQQLTGFFPFLRNRVIEQFTVMRREL